MRQTFWLIKPRARRNNHSCFLLFQGQWQVACTRTSGAQPHQHYDEGKVRNRNKEITLALYGLLKLCGPFVTREPHQQALNWIKAIKHIKEQRWKLSIKQIINKTKHTIKRIQSHDEIKTSIYPKKKRKSLSTGIKIFKSTLQMSFPFYHLRKQSYYMSYTMVGSSLQSQFNVCISIYISTMHNQWWFICS